MGRTDAGAEDDTPAALLLAAVVELARREAPRNPQALAWLAEWVEPTARELVARGRVRVAA
jgi:hypothetical protein